MDNAFATYLYCLVKTVSAPDTSALPRGLPETGAPRSIDAGGGLWLIACDAPLSRYGSEEIARGLDDLAWVSECAVAHEGVIEHFLDSASVIPMRLFTLFRGDDRALGHISSRRRELEAAFERIAGCKEWGLRIRIGSDRQTNARTHAPRADSAPTSGREFLLRKQERILGAKSQTREIRTRAESIYETLAAQSKEAIRRDPLASDGGLILEAAFLVADDGLEAFRAAVEEESAGAAREGCELIFTGPWPPFHFVGETEAAP